jgi:hypothetical protein
MFCLILRVGDLCVRNQFKWASEIATFHLVIRDLTQLNNPKQQKQLKNQPEIVASN